MRLLSFMNQYQRAQVDVGAEHPAVIAVVVHEGGRPIEEPLGILFGHIDATAAHGRSEVAVPVGAMEGVVCVKVLDMLDLRHVVGVAGGAAAALHVLHGDLDPDAECAGDGGVVAESG